MAEVSGRPWTGILSPMQVRPREHDPQENEPRGKPGVCLGHPKRLLKTVSWDTFRQMKDLGRTWVGGRRQGQPQKPKNLRAEFLT